ncbi:hypothetical protein [uncultured Deinococcus sp.]|uniref:hypothetical protein n=1 Tax=uncultured Deinococcus sp. TaxID=158789 RepID=UPI0025F8AB33|nr:hypothetical protein [uncultured Deinococcus sp.]
MTRSRPLGTSIARDTHERFTAGTREQVRAARAYAERWYQALRAWRLDSYDVPMAAGSGRGGTAVLLTSGTPGLMTCTYLQTPLGREVGEAQAGRTISAWALSTIPAQREAGQLLERLRAGQGPETLLRESGAFVHPVERARAYAVAVLMLAVTLGDREAESALWALKMVE